MDRFGHAIAIGLAFGMTVFVHELGHFVAARLSGMAVHEFSIGFGRPLLFWVRRGETQYSFRLWPFFSYVRIAGMEPGEEHPRGFNTKSRLAQAFVLVLGCLMNFMLGVAIFIFIGAVLGVPVEVTNRVDRVIAGEPAANAGIEIGDLLVGVDGERGLKLEEIQKHIQEHPGEPIQLEVERDGEPKTISLTPKQVPITEFEPVEGAGDQREGTEPAPAAGPAGEGAEEPAAPARLEDTKVVSRNIGRIGVVFEVKVRRLGVWASVVAGFRETYVMIRLLLEYLVLAVTGKMPLMLQGPVGVAHILYEEVQASWMSFLGTAAALTVGIGFLNLLPIPPLDGSRLVITGLEAIRRKPIDKQKENLVHLVGFGLLLTLVVVLTYKDIQRIITGGG